MRSLLLLLNGILLVGAQAVASPPNDNCGAATVIAGLPFTITVDATTATTEPTDPVQSCSAEEGAQSIWFTYTARRRTTLLIDSIGSDAHTTISVHSGSCVALSEVACESDRERRAGRGAP